MKSSNHMKQLPPPQSENHTACDSPAKVLHESSSIQPFVSSKEMQTKSGNSNKQMFADVREFATELQNSNEPATIVSGQKGAAISQFSMQMVPVSIDPAPVQARAKENPLPPVPTKRPSAVSTRFETMHFR
jgi:hypothetical protein